jgi:hypothetical protein
MTGIPSSKSIALEGSLISSPGLPLLARFLCVRRGEMYPASRRDTWRGKFPKADCDGRVALVLGCAGSAVESVQGFFQ